MYASKEELARAREMDLLTYLQQFEPNNLVYKGGGTYSTLTHDSLKISNGVWHWWSRGIGGRSALDYLIADGKSLPEAVAILNGVAPTGRGEKSGGASRPQKKRQPKPFALPPAHGDNRRVFAYLTRRGISPEIINHCIKHGLLFEDAEHHNAVFVGIDTGGIPRYATLRSTLSGSTFLRDVEGGDKRYCFSLRAQGDSNAVFVFEGAIDALSYATLDRLAGRDWRQRNYLSLGGVSRQPRNKPPVLPLALEQYLKEHPATDNVVLCLDADGTGRAAAAVIRSLLPGRILWDRPPRQGKDYNDYLQQKLNISSRVTMRGNKEPPDR